MATSIAAERRLLGDDFATVARSHYPALDELPAEEVLALARTLREQRDRLRGMVHANRRARRGKGDERAASRFSPRLSSGPTTGSTSCTARPGAPGTPRRCATLWNASARRPRNTPAPATRQGRACTPSPAASGRCARTLARSAAFPSSCVTPKPGATVDRRSTGDVRSAVRSGANRYGGGFKPGFIWP